MRPVTLENDFVRLEPLRAEHAADLAELTVGTGLTRWFPEPLETPEAADTFRAATLWRWKRPDRRCRSQSSTSASGRIVGSTRFLNIAAEHRRLEIGFTFIGALVAAQPGQHRGQAVDFDAMRSNG